MPETPPEPRVSRRDALRAAAAGTAAIIVAGQAPAEPPRPEPEFAPTDEYPFFGYEPAGRDD